jgi:hypothetical protein
MTFALFILGGLVLGAALAIALSQLPHARGYDDDAAAVLDMLCATSVCAIAVWVATSWALAVAGLLRAVPLTAAGVLEAAIGVGWLVRSRRSSPRSYRMMGHGTLVATIVALAPVALWIAFVTWRGMVLPPYNHDALSYHLPKAVLLMRAGGYHFFDVPEPRTATWPCNYELLLSDSMILTRGDHLTAIFSTLSYVVVVLLAARTAAAWWGGGAHVALVSAIVATAPVVILHSGLHKNDLLFCVFAMAAFAWAARWFAAGCTASALLAILALSLGLGTKLSAALVLPPVGALLAAGAIRHRAAAPRSRIALVCAGACVLSLLLGSGIYIDNVRHVHKLFLSPPQPRGYGAWSNIWEFTSMLVISPFARRENGVWNVFHHEYWWWPQNDVWGSDWGAVVSVLAFALVPCVWRYRTQGLYAERAATCIAATFTYIFMLPINVVPPGFYNSFVRYTVFVVPLIAAWTLSPLLLELERRAHKLAIAARTALASGVAAFGGWALHHFGLNDAYAPLVFVEHTLEHPDDRIPFVRRNRAASVVDVLAADTDTCAFDVGFDTWVYPAYGSAWTRGVEFLRPAAGDVVIPDSADWVAIDRSWNVFFGHPRFVDMGKWYLMGHGKPTDDDVKVYRQLKGDPRFELVYDDRAQNQAVFHRKSPGAT